MTNLCALTLVGDEHDALSVTRIFLLLDPWRLKVERRNLYLLSL